MVSTLLVPAGLFSIALGVWHLGVPRWFDFAGAVGGEDGGSLLRPMRFGRWSRPNTRTEVLGLTWVMSNAASYVLLSIGFVDLTAGAWLDTPFGTGLAAWIAGWWGVRAVSQLAVGRRRVDAGIAGAFGFIAVVHGFAALA